MQVKKVEYSPVYQRPGQPERVAVKIELNKPINLERLIQRNEDVEYDPDNGARGATGIYPIIKTNAGTVCFRRQSIIIRNPYKADVALLVDFAVSKLDERRISRSWVNFRAFWGKEVRDLDAAEKRLSKWLTTDM